MINTKKLTAEYLKNIKVNSVLDLGCEKGFKSLRFAKKNISVTGVDKKDFKIDNKYFEFKQDDILKFKFKKKYDLIISSLVLHFFKKEKAIELIKKIQANTKTKGYNFLVYMSNKDELAKNRQENFYPDFNSVKEIYSGWKIVKSSKGFTAYEEHDGTRHRHNLTIALMQKTK